MCEHASAEMVLISGVVIRQRRPTEYDILMSKVERELELGTGAEPVSCHRKARIGGGGAYRRSPAYEK